MKRYRPMKRTPMRNGDTGSFASRAETFSLQATAGVPYNLNNINLNNLIACQQLAQLYQYYRITRVEWRLKPNFDTFILNGTGGQAPYLYFLFDKAGTFATLTANQFEEAGAIPQRVDEQICRRVWKPAVSTVSTTTGGNAFVGQFKTSPWLPTYKVSSAGQVLNTPDHKGAVFYVSKSTPNDVQVYDIDITVTVQYRKPLVLSSSNVEEQTISLIKNNQVIDSSNGGSA